MRIYSFFSGDTTYLTKSRNLRNAQRFGRRVQKHYMDTCRYLDEEPELSKDEMKSYFIPEEFEKMTPEWARHLLDTDSDVVVLDDEIWKVV